MYYTLKISKPLFELPPYLSQDVPTVTCHLLTNLTRKLLRFIFRDFKTRHKFVQRSLSLIEKAF